MDQVTALYEPIRFVFITQYHIVFFKDKTTYSVKADLILYCPDKDKKVFFAYLHEDRDIGNGKKKIHFLVIYFAAQISFFVMHCDN